jgi:alcohol dehydrogenase class IV
MTVAAMRYVLSRIAEALGCEPESDDDLVEAVRLLVAERDLAKSLHDVAVSQRDGREWLLREVERELDEARAEVERLRARYGEDDR